MMFNTKQAAEYLGLKPVTLEAWRVRGGSPVFLKFGKAVRYCQTDLDEFKTSHKRTNTSKNVAVADR
jgi:predicted site-specific integrase-resolvase